MSTVHIDKELGLGMMLIGGENRPFHILSQRHKMAFTESMNIGVDDFWTKLGETGQAGKATTTEIITTAFIWSALFAGAIRVNRRCDFTYDDVLDWVEEAPESEAAEIAKPWTYLQEYLAKKNAELVAKMEQIQAQKQS